MILDKDGKSNAPLDLIEHRVKQAERRMEAALNEAMFGNAPEERVRALRESITGERPPSPRFTGFMDLVPEEDRHQGLGHHLPCGHIENEVE